MKGRTFIKQYKWLLALCNVTNDRDKCENITQYCGSTTNRLIEVLKLYQEGNWPTLKNQILKFFDTDCDLKQYKVRDLDDFYIYGKQFTKKLRHKLEACLLVGNVTQNMSTPFEADKIILAVEKLLQQDRFDTDQAWSDSEDGSDDDTSSSDSDSSSSDSTHTGLQLARGPSPTRSLSHPPYHSYPTPASK
ncbi:hypothetical protein BDN67DRAFT_984865 [Paxillus ammoniavirescens]|nr:hypothetical protein BDN67DRAFT_984865 [Paxillus ammoniavirescens]